jgi:hypothetical protein
MIQIKLLPETTLRKILNINYFKINAEFISSDQDISEYDIQHIFFSELKNQMKNKGCEVRKEKARVDITLTTADETKKYFFEVKSYIKNQERISFDGIASDIDKLEDLISGNDKIEKRGFMLLAICEKTLKNVKKRNKALADYLNHNTKLSPFKKNGFQHSLFTSFTIAHNNSNLKKNIIHQVRLYLIEIIKK